MNTLKFTERDVVDFVREGRCVAQMHSRSGLRWFLVPGGEIRADVAEKVIARKDIQPSNDGLFPGISHTFKYRKRH